MKAVCALILVLLSVVCAENAVKYAGTTTGGQSFANPSIDSSGVCTTSTNTNTYVQFNVTFATDGVREVAALAENAFKSSIRIYIYSNTFTASTPCAGLVRGISVSDFTGGSGAIPPLDGFVFFAAGTYQFVVTGSTGGIFAVNILPSQSTGTTSGSPMWMIPQSPLSSCSIDEDEVSPVGIYTWTQNTTGYFDISALFANTTQSDFGSVMAMYTGAVPTLAQITNNSCTAGNLTHYADGDNKGVTIYYAYLVAGTSYTIAFSGEEDYEFGYYGVQVQPTRIRFQKATPAFTQPSRSSTPPACTASSSTSSSWDTIEFTAENRAYLFDTATPPSDQGFAYFDTYSFLYSGDNSGLFGVFAPTTCPLLGSLVNYGDTGDITPVFSYTQPGRNYTVVVSTYGGGNYEPTSSSNYAYVLFYFTGNPIGAIPTDAPTASPTTGTPAATGITGAAATGATGTATSGPTAAPTTSKLTTTSSASTVAASFALMCGVALFAL